MKRTIYLSFLFAFILTGMAIAQTLTLTSPNGGETLTPGSTCQITWTGTAGRDSTRLEYSTDGGASWNRIVRSVGGTKYNWTVPNTVSRHCRLRAVQIKSEKTGVWKDSTVMWDGATTSISLSGDGALIAIGDYSMDWPIVLRDGATAMIRGYLRGVSMGIGYLQVSPDGKYVAAMGMDTASKFYLRCWTVADSTLQYTVPIYYGLGTFIRFSPDSRRIAIADGHFRVFDAATGTDLHVTPDTSYNFSSAEFSHDGRYIVIGEGKAVTIRNAGSGAFIRQLPNPFNLKVTYASPNSDGSRIAVADKSHLMLMDAVTGDTLYTVGQAPGEPSITSVRFSSDGSRLVVVRRNPAVRIYDAATGDLLYSFHGLKNPSSADLSDAALSEDGTKIVVSHTNGTDNLFHLLPTDASDNEWSIAGKGLSTTTVDLGSSKVGQQKDSIITSFLSNDGAEPVTITSITMIGQDAADFKLIDLSLPTTLSSAGVMGLHFAFTPSGPGLRSAQAMIVTTSDTLYANLTGTGVDTTAGVDLASAGESAEGLRLLGSSYPNPVHDVAHIRYSGNGIDHVTLMITDATGRVIAERSESTQGNGEHEITVDLASAPSGIYGFTLRSGDRSLFGTMIVQH